MSLTCASVGFPSISANGARRTTALGTVSVAAYWYVAKVRGVVHEDRIQSTAEGANRLASDSHKDRGMGQASRYDFATPKTTYNDGPMGRKIKELAANDVSHKSQEFKERAQEYRDEARAKLDELRDEAKRKADLGR